MIGTSGIRERIVLPGMNGTIVQTLRQNVETQMDVVVGFWECSESLTYSVLYVIEARANVMGFPAF